MPDDTNSTITDVENNKAPDMSVPKEEPKTETENMSTNDESLQKLINAKAEELLRPIKENLDSAYKLRDDALAKVAAFEEAKRAEEIKRLQEQGEHQKAFEMQLAEEKSRREALEKRNIELTRDVELRSVLSSIEFRSKNAADMAFKEIAGELVMNDKNSWVHKSGVSITDYVNAFVSDENNSFLLKQKVSTGAGTTGTTTPPSDATRKSLFSMSQEEVLKLAAEGKLSSH